jgi:Asp/Glu/hydantoin racemase
MRIPLINPNSTAAMTLAARFSVITTNRQSVPAIKDLVAAYLTSKTRVYACPRDKSANMITGAE